MGKFLVQCIKGVSFYFEEGKQYEVFWDGDGYFEPKRLIATDESRSHHTIAEHSLEDGWFKEHFEVSPK